MAVNGIEKQGNKGKPTLMKRLRWILIFAVVAVAIGVSIFLWWRFGRTKGSNKAIGTYTVRRDDLPITVTENGDIKAINSKEIKSEVEGRTTIISIVDEGTIITPEDVNNGKVLVELDSSDIEQKLTAQEVQFLSAEASYTDANESLDIQKKQNESDIKAGQLKVRFALMDLQKYLGEVVVKKLMSGATNPGHEPNEIASAIEAPDLGGEALQKLREMDNDIYMKEQQLRLAESELEWSEKLYEKEYLSRKEKESHRLDKEGKDIAWQKAKTAKDLFVKYEFPKQAEKLLSDHEEANRELERIEARARSKLTQAQARLKSSQATYLLQKRQLEKLQKQLKACTIKAPAPGQVVYGSSEEPWFRQDRQIEEGATIYERQKIISIPDPSEMKVQIKVHETWIDKVKVDQKANITVAAFPDETFTGNVMKKAPLAAQQWFLSQDLKVYETDVSIDGTHDSIKTGMSAKVEITIDELKDVLIVPIQAVITQEGKKVCYCLKKNRPQKREVETGSFNNNFVEIKSGLAEGDKVMLNPPRPGESEETSEKEQKADKTA
ncbi:MAG: efflux RND transporter periplasmic adaptor subunit [Planctomycetota bacterium]|jgi:RND family efflux transporter MFP subunit